MSGVLGKQNFSALINETSEFLSTKIDEDATISPQEISKDGSDSPGVSSSEMDSEGKFPTSGFAFVFTYIF